MIFVALPDLRAGIEDRQQQRLDVGAVMHRQVGSHLGTLREEPMAAGAAALEVGASGIRIPDALPDPRRPLADLSVDLRAGGLARLRPNRLGQGLQIGVAMLFDPTDDARRHARGLNCRRGPPRWLARDGLHVGFRPRRPAGQERLRRGQRQRTQAGIYAQHHLGDLRVFVGGQGGERGLPERIVLHDPAAGLRQGRHRSRHPHLGQHAEVFQPFGAGRGFVGHRFERLGHRGRITLPQRERRRAHAMPRHRPTQRFGQSRQRPTLGRLLKARRQPPTVGRAGGEFEQSGAAQQVGLRSRLGPAPGHAFDQVVFDQRPTPKIPILPQSHHRVGIAFGLRLDGPPEQQGLAGVGVVFAAACEGGDEGQPQRRRQSPSRTGQLIAHAQVGFLLGQAAQGQGHGLGHGAGIACQTHGPLAHGGLRVGQGPQRQRLGPPPAEVQRPERFECGLTAAPEQALGQRCDE